MNCVRSGRKIDWVVSIIRVNTICFANDATSNNLATWTEEFLADVKVAKDDKTEIVDFLS